MCIGVSALKLVISRLQLDILRMSQRRVKNTALFFYIAIIFTCMQKVEYMAMVWGGGGGENTAEPLIKATPWINNSTQCPPKFSFSVNLPLK